MKKISILLFAAAMGLLAASCVKEQPAGNESAFTLTVNISSEKPAPLQVKTVLGTTVENNKRKVYWSNGDAIAVNGVASAALAGLPDNASSASFTFASAPGVAPYSILYPAGIFTDATHVTLPAAQTYKSGSFADGMFPMAGYSADGSNISVHHLCAVLKVNIVRKSGSGADEDALTSATFRGLANEQVSGSFSIDYQNATLTGTSSAEADKKVKVARALATSAADVSYIIVVPARTYASGIAIDVQDTGGHLMTLSKAGSIVFEAGKLYDMQAVPFEPTGDAPATLTITSAEELIAFATAYNAGTLGGDDLIVTLGNDIAFDTTTSAAFNATGGIGASGALFNGLFDGAGYSINGLAATVPVFARVGKNGTVKDLTMGSTSSLTYSADISGDTCLGAIVGYSKGNITDCTNNTPVTCSSANRTDGVIYLGGVVGRQNETGVISGCTNNAAVSCTTAAGTKDVYIGGIAGSVERPAAANTANIQNCTNKGAVSEDCTVAPTHIIHLGGVVGWINSTSSSAKMTVTGLVNTGNVTKVNSAQANDMPVLVAGVVAGIHGSTTSTPSGVVDFKGSYVKNCCIQNGSYNNKQGYGTASHTAGFAGVARGNESSKNISFSDNSYVKDVFIICRRGFAGGFVSWARGAIFNGCKVINSSVRGTLAQCWYAGGMAGCAFDCDIKVCIVTLTKEDTQGNQYDTYTLFANGNANNSSTSSVAGGIVAQARGTTTIDGCKVFVKKMYQGTSGKEAFRGWIVGYADDNNGDESPNITIKDCAIGGACASSPAVTLSAANYENYLYGSKGTNATVTVTGTNTYWDASDAPAGNTIVSITISEYASDNGWTGTTNYYDTVSQGGVTLTASSTSGSNGNYNTQWRFYQARGGGLTISVSAGHSLVKSKVTHGPNNNGGILIAPDGVTQLPTDTWCPLSGESALFTVGSTTGKTNGRLDITKIVVEYE